VIVPGLCWSAKRELLDGVHRAEDEYRLALFTAEAQLGPNITTYGVGFGSVGEARGLGYAARGQVLRGRRCFLDDRVACVDFEDVVWPEASVKAAGALLFNASRGDAALAVLAFPEERESVNGPFTVRFPPPTKELAVVRFA
jgi:hypothetical protein